MIKLREALLKAFLEKSPPDADEYGQLADAACAVLREEPEALRPRDARGLPGGFLRLNPGLPTIIVPDLHARRGFFLSLMEMPIPGGGSILDALAAGQLQVLCLGDGFHAEGRALERWRLAFDEYRDGFEDCPAMHEEMTESMGLMEMVMRTKLACPLSFHFLKGNHENVLNAEGGGNHPFRKFVMEGDMVFAYLSRYYGERFMERYAAFEQGLPLFAQGGRFLASHAEPERAYSKKQLINARLDADVVRGLTWTDNDAAEPGAVKLMLARFLPDLQRPRYITGHRAVTELFRSRSEGFHLQIHNPGKYIIAWAMPDRDMEPDIDIGEIRDSSRDAVLRY